MFQALFRSNINLSRIPSLSENTGAQMTDGRFDWISQRRLTTTYTRCFFGSREFGFGTKYKSPALHLVEVGSVLKYVFDFPFEILRVGIHNLKSRAPRSSVGASLRHKRAARSKKCDRSGSALSISANNSSEQN